MPSQVSNEEPTALDRARGCLFGLAFGDALGAPTEFLKYADILRRWPPRGPSELAGTPARVTDDTQMALAVGEALVAAFASGGPTPEVFERELRAAFVAWLRAPDNDRAPGMTCLRACEGLEGGRRWQEATVAGSKGCGANMRVAPVGLLKGGGLKAEDRAALAQFQAALTHGHATALAASDLTARAVAELASGVGPRELVARLEEYALSQRVTYHERWLGDLWRNSGARAPEQFIARGWDECLGSLGRLEVALARPDFDGDPCLATGEGWVAEEALATGLLCFLLTPDDPRRALQRAAATSGDSDSIACLAGSFAGARHGLGLWPADWHTRIEYADRLEGLARALDALESGRPLPPE